jgi:hypothetical protein
MYDLSCSCPSIIPSWLSEWIRFFLCLLLVILYKHPIFESSSKIDLDFDRWYNLSSSSQRRLAICSHVPSNLLQWILTVVKLNWYPKRALLMFWGKKRLTFYHRSAKRINILLDPWRCGKNTGHIYTETINIPSEPYSCFGVKNISHSVKVSGHKYTETILYIWRKDSETGYGKTPWSSI